MNAAESIRYMLYPGVRYIVRTSWDSGEILEKGFHRLGKIGKSWCFWPERWGAKLIAIEWYKRTGTGFRLVKEVVK